MAVLTSSDGVLMAFYPTQQWVMSNIEQQKLRLKCNGFQTDLFLKMEINHTVGAVGSDTDGFPCGRTETVRLVNINPRHTYGHTDR